MDAGSVCGATSSSQTAHWQSTGAEVREGEGGRGRGRRGTDYINLYPVCRHVETLSAAVAMIVHRFSDSIQACKCESQATHCS